MATAEEIFNQAAIDIFNKQGVAALYTPSVGDPVSCQVDIERDVDLEPDGFNAQIWGRGITVEGILSVLGKEPDTDETFTITEGDFIDTVYTVKTIIENDGRFVKAVVKE
ncbi:unnamed protein product [marine sediment metagenome]|uniref:Uncharacterized protein n=1 Tax=marine sediment metagenome TaxID=412755 RepID=X0WIK9_9ZZZZ